MPAFHERDEILKLATALESPRARPINETFRRLELHLLAPTALRWALAPWAGDVTVRFRHSVREPGDFNVLFSDVDFDLVLNRDFHDDERRKLLSRLAKVRRLLPFLGETEIFVAREHRDLEAAEKRAGEVYSFIRMIRKLRWMDEATASNPIAYHRSKASRSNAITRRKISRAVGGESDLSTAVANWLDSRFTSDDDRSFEGDLWLDYLGYWVSPAGRSPDSRPALTMTRSRIATLASLLPEVFPGRPELQEAAKRRRERDSRLLEAWHQMVTIELSRQRAWGRAQLVAPDWHDGWVATLEGWHRSINP